MIRNTRKSNGAQKNGVMMTDQVEPLFGHHSTLFLVIRATPGECFPFKLDTGFSGRRVNHPNPFRDHLLTNSVTRNRRNSIFLHFASTRDNEIIPSWQRFRRSCPVPVLMGSLTQAQS